MASPSPSPSPSQPSSPLVSSLNGLSSSPAGQASSFGGVARTSHSPSPSRRYSHRAGSHVSNSSATLLREKPPPAALDTLQGWERERASGATGTIVVTPGPASLVSPYLPLAKRESSRGHESRHDAGCNGHGHDDGHNQGHEHHGHDHHGHEHHGHGHHDSLLHVDDEAKAHRSLFTRTIVAYTPQYPILHAILIDKDSRRIFYFMVLNFCFMAVQAFYGYVTDSLGLLSDSIHMFFDCVALLVGLLAAVMSKWPPSQRFPYGFGKIETLSGFANGILLMLLSVEIAFEAFERLWEGTPTKRLGELLIVSSLGLAVNLVGMMAFGHHHHHHGDEGHSHSHSHSHSNGDSSHGHSHSYSHGCGGSGGGHSHDNDNMHGIYLHILADTLGSVSVILSTILTSIWGWAGWDPLASCLIAVLIFASSKPLVVSSAKRLLLSVPQDSEYTLRTTLGGILQQRGVVGYSAPKVWPDDRTGGHGGSKLVGVVHVTAARGAGLEETRQRLRNYLLDEGVDVVVQVEREGDWGCWCAKGRTPVTPMMPKPL
ncbi:hypothetical protein CDD81_3922 [Ophiocordyceps australis]|uniref:Zinc transporter n=1 Tax=Ophiocordyceps australis TaxID=1399860 RepID=A0A2C5YAX5_9HYPO|nr:hypothetical protein CDD81_3922 [Ophiocordyceps australis]